MPENEYPEELPQREPETAPRYEFLGDTEGMPDFIREGLQGMMQTVGREANHHLAGQIERSLAHAKTDEEREQAKKMVLRFLDSLTTVELRDTLAWVLAKSAKRHREIDDESRRIWRFMKTTAKDPGATVIVAALAVLIGLLFGRRS